MERLDKYELNRISLRDEHIHRYYAAVKMARGSVVDCACGIGYASSLIVSKPNVTSYLGIDPDPDAVEFARQRYGSKQATFEIGTLEENSCKGESVDTFLVFETLEHVYSPEKALRSVKKRLKKNGLLIGSVPSREYEELCEQTYGKNKYHMHRFDSRLLTALLGRFFEAVQLFSAEYVLGTVFKEVGSASAGDCEMVGMSGGPTEVTGSIVFICGSKIRLAEAERDLGLGRKFFVGAPKALVDREEVEPLRHAYHHTELLVKERDAAIAGQGKMLEERWAALQAAEAMVAERDKMIRAQAQLVEEKDVALKAAEAMVRERDGAIAGQGKMLEERWAALQAAEAMVAERDKTIRAQAQLVEEKDVALKAAEAMVGERDAAIASQGKLLEQRWAALQAAEAMVSERDAAIAAQGQMLEARWKIVEEQGAVISDLRAGLDSFRDVTGSAAVSPTFKRQLLRNLRISSQVPFQELAFSLYLFTDRLFKTASTQHIQDLLFFAREGKLLKRCFDFYQNCSAGQSIIKTHYVEISRKASFLPSLGALENENFETLFRQYRRISLRDFLQSLALEEEAMNLASVIGVDVEGLAFPREDLPTDPLFHRLISSPEFKDLYERECASRSGALQKYLEQTLGAALPEQLHVVDVGWKGSIQDNLYNWLKNRVGEKAAITGYYVGLVAPGAASEANSKQALLFSSLGSRPTRGFHTFNENRSLFEMILHADHGSARAYKFDAHGNALAVADEYRESAMITEHIAPVTESVFRLFKQLCRIASDMEDELVYTETLRRHQRMVFSPSAAEIDWIQKIGHWENFGVFNQSLFCSDEGKPTSADKIKFTIDVTLRRNRAGLGFWPYLTIRRNALRGFAKIYAAIRKIADC